MQNGGKMLWKPSTDNSMRNTGLYCWGVKSGSLMATVILGLMEFALADITWGY